MRTLPFDETVKAIPVLVTITRGINTVRFTTWHSSLTVGSDTWVPAGAAASTDMTFASDGSPTSADISVSTGVVLDVGDVARGLYDGWPISIQIVDPEDLSSAVDMIPNATIGNVTETTNNVTIISVNGALTRTRHATTEHYSLTCRADLYDTRCKVVRASYTTSTTGEAIDNYNIQVAAADSRGSDETWYVLGLISFTSGALSGYPDFQIRAWDPGTLTATLFLPVATTDVPAGTSLDISAGCNFTQEHCFGKFDNIANMRAEIFVPPNDPRLI